MGPHLSNSIVVTVGVRANSEPGESRRLRVPFARLNQTMQMLHAHGIVRQELLKQKRPGGLLA